MSIKDDQTNISLKIPIITDNQHPIQPTQTLLIMFAQPNQHLPSSDMPNLQTLQTRAHNHLILHFSKQNSVDISLHLSITHKRNLHLLVYASDSRKIYICHNGGKEKVV